MITLVNLRDGVKPTRVGDFYCDRRSPVGNPYKGMRDPACDAYATYFHDMVTHKKEPKFMAYLDDMLKVMAMGEDIRLFCWCVPLRCHTETIKAWLEAQKV